jgi:hypothetical protein
MKLVIVYLVLILVCLLWLLVQTLLNQLPFELGSIKVGLMCSIIGGIGGCIYCLRAAYLNACVRKLWDKEWMPWYYILPIVTKTVVV